MYMKKFGIDYNTPIAVALDKFLVMTRRDDFIFNSKHKLATTFASSRGKFSNLVSDSVFLDSTKFHVKYTNKIFDRILLVIKREMTQNPKSDLTEADY